MKRITFKTKEQWLELRKKGIGGSDAPAIAGVSAFSNPIKLWLEKTGQTEPNEPSERMEIGNYVEETIVKIFEAKTGKKTKKGNYIIQHDEYPYILGSVDRWIVGEKAILECKSTASYNIKDILEKPFDSWIIQCQHYLAITGYQKAYLAILAGNEKFIIHEVERDDELIAYLLELEKQFWHYIETNTMPEVNEKDLDIETIQKIYAKDTSKTIDLPAINKLQIEKYIENQKKIKELQKENECIKKDMLLLMQDAGVAVCDNYILKVGVVKKEGYYVKPQEYQTFSVKQINKEED